MWLSGREGGRRGQLLVVFTARSGRGVEGERSEGAVWLCLASERIVFSWVNDSLAVPSVFIEFAGEHLLVSVRAQSAWK